MLWFKLIPTDTLWVGVYFWLLVVVSSLFYVVYTGKETNSPKWSLVSSVTQKQRDGKTHLQSCCKLVEESMVMWLHSSTRFRSHLSRNLSIFIHLFIYFHLGVKSGLQRYSSWFGTQGLSLVGFRREKGARTQTEVGPCKASCTISLDQFLIFQNELPMACASY